MQRSLLRHLSDKETRIIGRIMAHIGRVNAKDVHRTITEFILTVTTPTDINGTPTQTQNIFTSTFDRKKSETLTSEIRLDTSGQTIWEVLSRQPLPILVSYLIRQSPENGAVILYHLPPKKAAAVLELLPEEKTAGYLLHLTHLKHIRPSVRIRLEQELIRHFYTVQNKGKAPAGTEQVGSILTHLPPLYQDDVLAHLTQRDPSIAHRLALSRLTWTDLSTWPQTTVRQLLPYLSRHVTAMALHNADTAIITTFKNALGPTAWQRIGQDITTLSQTDKQTTLAARETILQTIRDLVHIGKITLPC